MKMAAIGIRDGEKVGRKKKGRKSLVVMRFEREKIPQTKVADSALFHHEKKKKFKKKLKIQK